MTAAFRIEVLQAEHDRAEFISGSPALDRYFREQVTQDVRRRITACYVALDISNSAIAGFFTLAASGIPLTELPLALGKKLPRYPLVPVARMGRLAVGERYHGHKLGSALLWDAARRAATSEVAAFALVVDAKDPSAEAFYRHHGFIPLGTPLQLALPLANLRLR